MVYGSTALGHALSLTVCVLFNEFVAYFHCGVRSVFIMCIILSLMNYYYFIYIFIFILSIFIYLFTLALIVQGFSVLELTFFTSP